MLSVKDDFHAVVRWSIICKNTKAATECSRNLGRCISDTRISDVDPVTTLAHDSVVSGAYPSDHLHTCPKEGYNNQSKVAPEHYMLV